MLGLDSYGSGSEDEQVKQPPKKAFPSVKIKPKKKITIGFSSLPQPKNDDETSDSEGPSASKKRRLESGADASSLLSMLPAPKKKGLALPPPSKPSKPSDNPYISAQLTPTETVAETEDGLEDDIGTPRQQNIFVPASLRKGHPNIPVEEGNGPKSQNPASGVNFFGLGSSSTTKPAPLPLPSTPGPTSSSSSAVVSSAPSIATFEPPEPTPTDPYPGYYQLPSGAWAAYDPEYYGKFMKKWQAEYDRHVRALEKGTAKGFEEMDTTAMHEVDAQKEMERAKVELRDLEERKALTQGAGGGSSQPNMKITASKMSGIARSRHQLSTLLREAYENREALEERIAQGKRNRKEAGNKYGMLHGDFFNLVKTLLNP